MKKNKATIWMVIVCVAVLAGVFTVSYLSKQSGKTLTSAVAPHATDEPRATNAPTQNVTDIVDVVPAADAETPAPTRTPMATMNLDFSVTVSTPVPTPMVTPRATMPVPPDKLTVFDEEYTIAWMSDTQHYSDEHPFIFNAMTKFLYDERERLNLQYVVHTGDLVHEYNNETQWANAVTAMDNLRDIPYGVLAGNHDVKVKDDDVIYKYYKKYFGEERMKRVSCFGESYEDNQAHYDLVDAGATRFVFVYISYPVSKPMVIWANNVFEKFQDRVGVLCTHDYFKTDMTLSASGETLFDDVVSKNKNIYLVLCGHRYNNGCAFSQFDDDGDGTKERIVYQMMSNYQAAGKEGGNGYMRFMQFDEVRGVIRMYGYSPYFDDYVYYDAEDAQAEEYSTDPKGEEFEIPIPWLLELPE